MPEPVQRQLLGDAIRGELLTAHHGTTEIDELTDRVLAAVEKHQPVTELDRARRVASRLRGENRRLRSLLRTISTPEET